MGAAETKQQPLPKDQEEAKGPILSEFYQSLRTATAALADLDGIDFEGLPQTEQLRLELALLQEAYTTIDRDLAFSQQLTKRESAPRQEILINPNPIRVTVVVEKKTAELTLGHDRKGMLAYFVALTQEMVRQHMQPWITAKELGRHANFTREQLYNHFFGPLAKAGVIEIGANRGYRLLCRPADVWNILLSSEPCHSLQIFDFDSWAGTDLLKEHQLKLLRALSDQYQAATAEGYLDTRELQIRAGLSRSKWFFTSLRELENLGFIRRSGNRYKMEDLNLPLIQEVVGQCNEPIVIDYIKMGSLELKQSRRSSIDTKRATPLKIKEQEDFEFPAVSWTEADVAVGRLNFSNREQILKVIDTVLTSEFGRGFTSGQDGHQVYLENRPLAKEVDEQVMFAVLEFLGVGPEELRSLLKNPNDTLAASLRRLEQSSLLREKLFLAEVKARLASLILDEIIVADEGGHVSFANLMGMLEESSREIQPEPVKTTLLEEAAPIIEVPVREKGVTPDHRGALLATLQRPLAKEIAAATSQESSFAEFLPPVAAFNFHRILSNKADFIPWEELIAFGLAEKGVSDHHPRINAAGALIAALYLTPSVHNRILAACKTETRALRTLTECVCHLLTHIPQDGEEQKKAIYVQSVLESFSVMGIVCNCAECQQLRPSK